MAKFSVLAFLVFEVVFGDYRICLERDGIGKAFLKIDEKLMEVQEIRECFERVIFGWKDFKVILEEDCFELVEGKKKIQFFNATLGFREDDEVFIEVFDFSSQVEELLLVEGGFGMLFDDFDLNSFMKGDLVFTLSLSSHRSRSLASSCTDDLCSACEEDSCYKTYAGYYLDENKNVKKCAWGCKNCESDSKCSECSLGFFLDTNFCFPCSGYCLSCINQTNCKVCQFGYFIENNLCNPCLFGCIICNNASNCGKCDSGFYLDSDGFCVKCSAGCQICNEVECLIALTGYFLNDLVLPCSQNCSSCDNIDTCKTCSEGFFINSKLICQPCQSHCKSCGDSEVCEECEHGYFLTPTKSCSKCKTNCNYCLAENYCEECESGYYYNKKLASCIKCEVGCANCIDNQCLDCASLGYNKINSTCEMCLSGAARCDDNIKLCFEGFYLLNSNCSECDDLCKSCFEGICTSCYEGYYLNSTCFKCRHGCNICTYNDCLSCSTGFFLFNNECLMCPIGCFNCENENSCLSCEVGFYLSDNTCRKCSESFYHCKSLTEVLKCESNYYLNNSNCLSCDDQCNWCNFSTCFSCDDGSYKQNEICSECPFSFCSSCTQSSCLSCKSGYFLDTNNNCSACPSFCSSCSSASSCLICDSGYRITSKFLCEACPSFCNQCSEFQCIKCNEGFALNLEGDCKVCNDAKCLCIDGYFNNDNYQCEECPFRCLTCSNSTACLICRSGYRLSNIGECTRCSQSYCSDCPDDKCVSCLNGFYIEDSECFSCSFYCISCTSFSYCLECAVGFELLNDKYCIPCPTSCASCSSGICLTCIQGYQLSEGVCEETISNCLIYNNSICSYCSGGLKVLNGICADCKGVSILSAEFDEFFKRLRFTFNRNIENSDEISCDECKTILVSDGNIGDSCYCYGKDNIYELVFKSWYSITLSSTFFIKTEKLFKYVCESNELSLIISPSYTIDPSAPSATIKGSTRKSLNCADEYLYFDIGEVINSYGFDLNFTWFALTTPTNPLIEAFALANKQTYLMIPLSAFSNNSVEVLIKVTVQNMVRLSTTTNFSSVVYSEKMLQTEIDSPAFREIEYTKDYVISGRVSDFCMKESATTRWKFDQKNQELFDGGYSHLLYIPAFNLTPLKSHFFNFTAFSGELTGYSELEVFVKYSPLILIIDLTNCSVSLDSDLKISADDSYNPNNLKDNLLFFWEYCEWKNFECNDEVWTFDEAIFFKQKEELPVNGTVWRFEVTLSSDLEGMDNVYQIFYLEFITGLSSNIQILPYSFKPEMTQSLAVFSTNIKKIDDSVNLTLKWEFSGLTSSNFDIVGIDLPIITMNKKVADFDYNYVLTLKAYQGSQFSYAQFFFQINQGPLCPSEGLMSSPSSKITAFKTLVDLSIKSCTDIDNDFPLLYRFSVKICSYNCTLNYSGEDPNIYTPYFQVSIKKQFSYFTCKMPEGVVKASAQVCDQLGGCNAYKKLLQITKNSNLDSVNVIEQYYLDIANPDMIPYYSIIYMTLFDLNSEQFNNIYQNFYGYLKKMRVTNLDVIHILLTFINEMFKSNNKFLSNQLIIKFLNDATSIVARHSEDIIDQNAEVTSEIIFNIINSGIDSESDPSLINIAMDFVQYIYKEYGIKRLPGDLIVNYTTQVTGKNNFEYLKYRNTLKNITEEIDSSLKSLIKYIKNVNLDPDTIMNVDVCSLELKNGQGIILIHLTKSGSYNETSLNLTSSTETFVNLNTNGAYLYVKNQYSNQVCVYFNGQSWIDSLCKIEKSYSETSISGIIVSSSAMYKIADSNSYYQEEPVTYGPLILAGVLTGAAIFVFIGLYFYERVTLKEPKKKKRQSDVHLESTCGLILKHMLILSFFSKDPEISKKMNLLKLIVLFNVQITIEGVLIGFDVIDDEKWPVIVGTGFIAPLLTVPYNVFYLWRIDSDRKCLYYGFIAGWFLQLVGCLILILVINIYKTKGRNSYWILAFGIGLVCEIIVETIVMTVHNIRISNIHPPSNKI